MPYYCLACEKLSYDVGYSKGKECCPSCGMSGDTWRNVSPVDVKYLEFKDDQNGNIYRYPKDIKGRENINARKRQD